MNIRQSLISVTTQPNEQNIIKAIEIIETEIPFFMPITETQQMATNSKKSVLLILNNFDSNKLYKLHEAMARLFYDFDNDLKSIIIERNKYQEYLEHR